MVHVINGLCNESKEELNNFKSGHLNLVNFVMFLLNLTTKIYDKNGPVWTHLLTTA